MDAVPPDAGVYECVAKNPAGEVRCKSRLNMVLAKTGAEAEKGPKQEAPRFAEPIKPVVGAEGANAEFRAKYSGEPGEHRTKLKLRDLKLEIRWQMFHL